MAEYIKSHSNYVLKSKHQQTTDGTIFERDITTIGGRNQFAKGQVPIYQSGNFVITVNNDNKTYKKVNKGDWYKSEYGEIWTQEITDLFEKESSASDDAKIIIKKDYHDLRDFAYYGSCSELIRGSIDDILKRFPGEIFIPSVELFYKDKDGTTIKDVDTEPQYNVNAATAAWDDKFTSYVEGYTPTYEIFETINDDNGNPIEQIKKQVPFSPLKENGEPVSDTMSGTPTLVLVDNPFNVDMHTRRIGPDDNIYKFFANDGVSNYIGYMSDNWTEEGEDNVKSDNIISTMSSLSGPSFWGDGSKPKPSGDMTGLLPVDKGMHFTDVLENADGVIFDGNGLIQITNGGKVLKKFYLSDYYKESGTIQNAELQTKQGRIKVDVDGKIIYIPIDNTIKFTNNNEYDLIWDVVYDGLGESVLQTEFVEFESKIVNICNGDPKTQTLTVYYEESLNGEIDGDIINLCPGDYLGYIRIGFIKRKSFFDADLKGQGNEIIVNVYDKEKHEKEQEFYIYIFVGNNGKIVYTVDANDKRNLSFRIRPKQYVIDEFFNSLDSFQTVLLDRSSDPLYTATFEIIDENDSGYYTYTDRFTFPTTYGGYNLGSNNVAFERYLERFSKIATFYDEKFSDNLWRSMTHEAIKNFDWTFTRVYNEGDKEPFVEGGQKIQKIIRLYAREFDEIKGYIDAIRNINNVTYSDTNSMPDYFFTDKLEYCGWDIVPIYPLVLNEYINNMLMTPFDFHSQTDFNPSVNEPSNKYNISGNTVHITRVFNQDYDGRRTNPYFVPEDKVMVDKSKFVLSLSSLDMCNYEGDQVVVLDAIGEDECDKQHPSYYFNDKSEYSYVDANNEFYKRLILNSKSLIKHKGTIEGLEMMFALFNMKRGIDYDVNEYTVYAPYIKDEWENSPVSNPVDFVNSTKTIAYNTSDFRNGIYTPYRGLPISYREVIEEGEEKPVRRLYPHFQSGVEYDGGMYYQMRGGWMGKSPFIFDVKNNIIPEDFDKSNRKSKMLFTETVKNVQTVQTLQDLLQTPSLATNSGNIVQVIDLSGRYAVVDGKLYPLINNIVTTYDDDGNIKSQDDYSYFTVVVEHGSIEVGDAVFYDRVYVSDPNYVNKRRSIDLNDENYNGTEINIYVLKEESEDGKWYYTVNVSSNNSSINTFTVFENGKYMEGDNFTNFFRIGNTDFYNELSVFGWQQLRDDDYEYLLLDSIIDRNDGNNPHNGWMNYDSGHEYLLRFKDLFKYTRENDKIDYRLYDTNTMHLLNIVDGFGFSNLVKDDECDNDYDEFLVNDSKCHYFGNFVKKEINENGETVGYSEYIYDYDYDNTGEEREDDGTTKQYHYGLKSKFSGKDDSKDYIIDTNTSTLQIDNIVVGWRQPYGNNISDGFDSVTDHIVNTKRFDLTIYITEEDYTKGYLEQVKYYDSVVLNYITQMLPSTIISHVKYESIYEPIEQPVTCSCGSYSFDNIIAAIGSNGFEGTLFTIKSGDGCPINSKALEVYSNNSNVQNLNIDQQGNVTCRILQNNGDKTNITIYVKHVGTGTICKTITLGQESGADCSCNDLTIVKSDNLQTTIPTEGVKGTITITSTCARGGHTFDVTKEPNVDWITISRNGNEFTITVKDNPKSEDRSANLRIVSTFNGNSDNCDGDGLIAITQSGVDCSCSNLTIEKSPELQGDIPATGVKGTITITSTCGRGGHTFDVVKKPNVDWITISRNGNVFTITVDSNSGSEDRSANLQITSTFNGNSDNCDGDGLITITQSAMDCSCDEFKWVSGGGSRMSVSKDGVTNEEWIFCDYTITCDEDVIEFYCCTDYNDPKGSKVDYATITSEKEDGVYKTYLTVDKNEECGPRLFYIIPMIGDEKCDKSTDNAKSVRQGGQDCKECDCDKVNVEWLIGDDDWVKDENGKPTDRFYLTNNIGDVINVAKITYPNDSDCAGGYATASMYWLYADDTGNLTPEGKNATKIVYIKIGTDFPYRETKPNDTCEEREGYFTVYVGLQTDNPQDICKRLTCYPKQPANDECDD